MRKILLPVLAAGILLLVSLAVFSKARGQIPGDPEGAELLASETEGESLRAIYAPAGAAAPDAPDISFIDSPTVACYQPDPAEDACYINWYYMSVDASPNYLVAMTVTIDTIGVVSRYHGFFQNSMYVPFSMQDRGFKVACGAPGAGGQADLGNAYSWTIRARDSANLSAANYGTVYCPPFAP